MLTTATLETLRQHLLEQLAVLALAAAPETSPIEACPVDAQWKTAKGGFGLRLQPASVEQVACLVKACAAVKQPLAVFQEDALALELPVWLDLSRLTATPEYQVEDLVVTTQTGVSMGELAKQLATHGHALPLAYPPSFRLADVLALDWPSLNSGLRRSLKEYVLGTELVDGAGSISNSGGKVVKNVTGYDLHKFYVGSLHQFGVVTKVSLRLAAQPALQQSWVLGFASWQEAERFSRHLLERPCSSLAALELWEPVVRPVWLGEVASKWPVLAYVETSGSTTLVTALERTLQPEALQAQQLASLGLYPLTTEQQEELVERLGQWPGYPGLGASFAIQLGLPFNGWFPALEALRQMFTILNDKPCLLQARPAIGLLQVQWDDFNLDEASLRPALEAFAQTWAANGNGWMQVVTAPFAWLPWVQTLNRPNQAAGLGFLQRLKHLWDAENVFHSQRLRLSP